MGCPPIILPKYWRWMHIEKDVHAMRWYTEQDPTNAEVIERLRCFKFFGFYPLRNFIDRLHA